MTTVALISKSGVEFSVDTPFGFVDAVYGNGAVPKTGSVESNYQSLLGGPPPSEGANDFVTNADLDAVLAALSDIEPPSGSGENSYVHTQSSPSASWSISNPLGRLPGVSLYVGGTLVEADVDATNSTVHISFPTPVAGYAVLA